MYYNLRRTDDGYRMVKFDSLFNVEAIYNLRAFRGKFLCDCPAYKYEMCKHREMIPVFIASNKVNTGEFLCFDTGEWHPPVEGLVFEDIVPAPKIGRPRRDYGVRKVRRGKHR